MNDGSTDHSGEILNEYARLDERVVVIHQENAGVSAARNAALSVANGDYVTCVDSDDWIPSSTYEKLLPWLQKNIDMVCYGITGVSETGEPVQNEYFNLPEVGEHVVDAHLIAGTNSYVWNKMFRMELIRENKVLFPVGMRYEDAVFFYIAAIYSKSICFVPDVKYVYLIRGDSFTNGEAAKNRAFDFCEILEVIYKEFQKRQMIERWSDLYREIFLLFYEQTVPLLPSVRQKKAKLLYKSMVRRLGLHLRYPGVYPFHELSRYSRLRALFYWRNEKTRVFKLGKWVVLRIEYTLEGVEKHWF